MNPLFVGIDVGSQNNAVYLMKPDGSKHSSFTVQNNRGGTKVLTERVVPAIQSQGLTDVVIGMEATSIYGDSLVYALREDGRPLPKKAGRPMNTEPCVIWLTAHPLIMQYCLRTEALKASITSLISRKSVGNSCFVLKTVMAASHQDLTFWIRTNLICLCP